MKKKIQFLECDVCGKSTTDEGEVWFGGHPFSFWFHLSMNGGPTDLESLHAQKEWDICSKKCLENFAIGKISKKVS